MDGQGWVVGWSLGPNLIIPLDTKYTNTSMGLILHDYYEVLPESVGQWTGLVDKNGKEIFEGDVIKAENAQNIGGIKYVHEHGSFLVYSHDENGAYYEYLDIGLCEKYFEIIGNMIDSPELMEV